LRRKGSLLLVGVAAAALLGTPGTAVAAPGGGATDGAGVLGFEEARRTPVADGAPAARARVTAAEAVATDSAGSAYVPVSPVRLLDTRAGSPIGPGATTRLSLADRVPVGTTAVVLNVTGVSPTLNTFVTVWSAAGERPTASNLNLRAGEIRANAATVSLQGVRDLSIYNNSGTTHTIVDLVGYYAPGTGSRFTAQSPARVLDTRTTGGALGAGATRVLDLSSRVPATATAVTFNLTGASATANTFVTAMPAGAARPIASSLNLVPGQVTPNLVTVALSADKKIALYNHVGSTHLIVDLAGYYATDRGDAYYQLSPVRMVDSRFGQPLGAGGTATVALDTDLPASASAAVFNLTGTDPTAATFLTAYPAGAARPTASNVNLVAGQTAANLATVAVGSNRSVSVYNLAGTTDYLIDLAGYFAPVPAACTTDCVHSWADNTLGQLGVGTVGGFSTTPGRVDGLSGVTQVTGSFLNGYALTSGGTVWAWGDNSRHGLGNGKTYGTSPVPARVGSLTGVTQVAAGVYSGYAVKSNGEVWAWGYNGDGSLGVGNVNSQYSPVKVNTPSGITQVAAGYTTAYALRNDGTVWAWGANGGSLGNGFYGTGCDTTPVGPGCRAVTPVQVPGLTGVTSIAATRNAAFAVKGDGTVMAWGYNAHGELGIGTVGGPACSDNPQGQNCVALSPVQIPGLTGVAKVASGSVSTTYAIKTDGTALAWGWNGEGQLGNGTTGGQCTDPSTPNCVAATPVQVSNLTNVTELVGGDGYALALGADGLAYGWGWSPQGQTGNTAGSGAPERVGEETGVRTIGSGGTTSYLVK
jgi:alpha-tubulin suppressor-like RCC1 family protein